jgi:hypothetical protein
MSEPKRRTADEQLLAKIRSLPPERVSEVEDFMKFLCHKDGERQLIRDAGKLSEDALARVWDNADDAEYDRL